MISRNLENEARSALSRWEEMKKHARNGLDPYLIVKGGEELERYLRDYVAYHAEAKLETRSLEKRRQDHWDLLNKKCSEDPMFCEMWNELLLLLKLEDNNLK